MRLKLWKLNLICSKFVVAITSERAIMTNQLPEPVSHQPESVASPTHSEQWKVWAGKQKWVKVKDKWLNPAGSVSLVVQLHI